MGCPGSSAIFPMKKYSRRAGFFCGSAWNICEMFHIDSYGGAVNWVFILWFYVKWLEMSIPLAIESFLKTLEREMRVFWHLQCMIMNQNKDIQVHKWCTYMPQDWIYTAGGKTQKWSCTHPWKRIPFLLFSVQERDILFVRYTLFNQMGLNISVCSNSTFTRHPSNHILLWWKTKSNRPKSQSGLSYCQLQ